MTGRLWHLRTVLAPVAIAACGLVARGDDVAVDEQPGGRPVMRGMSPEYDLGQLFDSQAFQVQPGEDAVARGLEPAQRRAAARIEMVDRIVGLSDKQRKKLEVAAQSDLRRLSDEVAEVRAKYAGRKVKMDPRNGGLDEAGQKEMQQAHEDAQRCRQLVQAACGPESLLAKVVVGALDEEQAKRYSTVMQGRAACRWKAVVAAGLAQLDDQIGFAQNQHDAVAALLLSDPPVIEEEQVANPVPAAVRVAQRIAACGDEKLAAILDPRQLAMIASFSGMQGGEWPVPVAMPFAVPIPMPAIPPVPR